MIEFIAGLDNSTLKLDAWLTHQESSLEEGQRLRTDTIEENNLRHCFMASNCVS